jgi:hypothetical protein
MFSAVYSSQPMTNKGGSPVYGLLGTLSMGAFKSMTEHQTFIMANGKQKKC